MVTQIRLAGQDACSAMMTYYKAHGHVFFESTRINNGDHMFSSDEHVGGSDVHCDRDRRLTGFQVSRERLSVTGDRDAS
jgi:hypothetical protein